MSRLGGNARRLAAFRLGVSAESYAAIFLGAKGYRTIARRWKSDDLPPSDLQRLGFCVLRDHDEVPHRHHGAVGDELERPARIGGARRPERRRRLSGQLVRNAVGRRVPGVQVGSRAVVQPRFTLLLSPLALRRVRESGPVVRRRTGLRLHKAFIRSCRLL